MPEIIIRRVSTIEIGHDFLKGFNRHQNTEKVLFWSKGVLVEKVNYFQDEWDSSSLIRIAKELEEISLVGVVVAAFSEGKVIGFTCIDDELFNDGYINMPYLHVTYDKRGQGIGKKLFLAIQEEAKKFGAKKLYISGHPDVKTQTFYKEAGCIPAQRINKRLYDVEPFDIHLEKEI